MFRHPKYYKELRKRNTEAVAKSGKSHASLESDQVISGASATASVQRAPGPGLTTLKKLVDKLNKDNEPPSGWQASDQAGGRVGPKGSSSQARERASAQASSGARINKR